MHRSLLLFLAFPVLLAACADKPATPAPSSSSGAAQPAAAGLPDRDPALAKKLIAEGAVLLDVRSPQEWESGHAAGATLIPVGELGSRLAEVDKLTGGDKQKPIVVYCASGARSGQAKKMLVAAGHTQVTNVGGLSALQ